MKVQSDAPTTAQQAASGLAPPVRRMQNAIRDGANRSLVRVCYALPYVSMAMLWTPLNVMQGIYIKDYGFSMSLMAVILLSSRIYDAVADLAVGAISDWAKAKTGKRKPLFAIGAVLFSVTGIFVYVPPRTVAPLYLTFWLFAFFTGYAMLMISHLAWGSELARNSRQKTEIFSARAAAGYIGLCLFYSIPLLPIFPSAEITPETIKWSVYLAVAILAPALILCLKFVPEGSTTAMRPGQRSALSLESLSTVVANRSFVTLMCAYVLCGGGLGIWYGMIFIFMDIYLKRGELFAPLYLLAFGLGAVSALAWNKLAAKIGKKATWSTGMGLALAAVLATSLLTPHNAALWSIGLILIASTLGLVNFELIPGSILSDIADHSLLRSGRNQAATYFSIYMFLTKVVFALGAAIGLGLAGWLGFAPRLHEQSTSGVFALNVVMSWLPGVLLVAAIVFIQLVPMNERRHAIIRKRLDQNEARASKALAGRQSADSALGSLSCESA